MNKEPITIVLTGTIRPNINIGNKINSEEERRNDYLNAIRFYVKYAPVIFLENSTYNLNDDIEFKTIENLYIYKMSPSKYISKGKSFQEFEMLDAFINRNQKSNHPITSFLKITGRYIIDDFEKIYKECIETDKDMLINIFRKSKWADTYMFFCRIDTYQKYFMGIYKKMDDNYPEKSNAERTFFRYIFNNKNIKYRMFFFESNILATCGGTGNFYPLKSNFRLRRRRLKRKIRYYILNKPYLR